MRGGSLGLAAAAGVATALVALVWRRANRVFRRLPHSILLDGKPCPVRSERVGPNVHISLDDRVALGKLPFKLPFCMATASQNGMIHVSGTIGLAGGEPGRAPKLVGGGVGPETRRTLELMDAALRAAGASANDIVMVHIFLTEYSAERFAELNAAYIEFWGGRPLPARITSGSTHLALGAAVEMDAVAYAP